MGFVTRFLNSRKIYKKARSFPRNSTESQSKVNFTEIHLNKTKDENSARNFYWKTTLRKTELKIDESWKFDPRILLRELKIQPENSTKRQFYKEIYQIKRNHKKALKFKELCFPNTLSQINSANYIKICDALSFPSFFSCFFCIKFVSKTLSSVLSFWISIWTRKLRNLLFKITY